MPPPPANPALLHPTLAGLLPQINEEYEKADPGYRLHLACTYRDAAAQAAAFANGTSAVDGVHSFSRHQFSPALAFDCWCMDEHGTPLDPTDDLVTWNFRHYSIYGSIVEAHGLEWGGRWTKPHDGPHAQIPWTEVVREVQLMLIKLKILFGAADGKWGPLSKRAWLNFQAMNGMRDSGGVIDPPTWHAIWTATHKQGAPQ